MTNVTEQLLTEVTTIQSTGTVKFEVMATNVSMPTVSVRNISYGDTEH
jgi:hypothetical protein